MASSSKPHLNPLRSRHASQGALVLPAPGAASKIVVAAARPPSGITTTNGTPFSPTGASPESADSVQTAGAFLSVPPSSAHASLFESSLMSRRGFAKDAAGGSQRSQRLSEGGSPTASRPRHQAAASSAANDVSDSPSPMDKPSMPARRNNQHQEHERTPPTQYARTQSPNRPGPGHAADDRSAAAALRSTGLAYDDVVETEAVEDLCLMLGLDRSDVRRLRRQFNDEDGDNTDTITQSAFFYLIGEERHNLSCRLFRLAGLPPTQPRLSFDQYLTIVATFATFTESELLKFFYDVYCADTASGAMLTSEIQSLGDELRAVNKGLAKNITVATNKMASSRNVLAVAVASTPATSQQQQLGVSPMVFTFADFEKIVKKHLAAFYPLIRMQRNLRRATLSEAFWAAKTRDKQAVQATLAYMKAHQGRVPELSIRDRLAASILRWETSGTRVRALAKKIYAAKH